MSFGSLYGTFNGWLKDRATARQLNALTDEQLEDIGLCRAEIDDVVTGRSATAVSKRKAWRRMHLVENGLMAYPGTEAIHQAA